MAKRTDIVWQTFEILLVKHNVWPLHKHVLDKHFSLVINRKCQKHCQAKCACRKQNELVIVTNRQACLTSKIQNVYQEMLVRLAGASVVDASCELSLQISFLMCSSAHYTVNLAHNNQSINILFCLVFLLNKYLSRSNRI